MSVLKRSTCQYISTTFPICPYFFLEIQIFKNVLCKVYESFFFIASGFCAIFQKFLHFKIIKTFTHDSF